MRSLWARSGFSLLEISIVLAIISVIVGGGMTVFSSYLQKRQWDDTKNRQKFIQTALYNYRLANNRIPCPADLTIAPTAVNFGVEGALPDVCTGGTPAANFINGVAIQAGNTATFVKTDAVTQGNWVGVYGGDGYAIEADSTNYPPYASVSFSGPLTYTWAGSTSDIRALQKGSNHADRIAPTWYTSGSSVGSSYTINVNMTDSQLHQIALYPLDWDNYGPRQERIDVVDANTSAVLDSRTVTSFVNGIYYVWKVSGNINFVITNLVNGGNGVLSGFFFDSTVPMAEGMVPTKTLRLPDDYAFDGWGRRIMYAVDVRFTATSAFTSNLATTVTTRMTIKDASSNTKTTAAGYVLISLGPNGHGAYPRAGGSTRINYGSINTDELKNCDCTSAAVSNATLPAGVFVQKDATQDNTPNPLNNFDDVVAFGTRSDLRSPTE